MRGTAGLAATPLLLGITLLTLAAQGLDQGWSAVILPVDVRDKMHSVLALGAAESAFAAGALIGAGSLGLAAATAVFGGIYLLVTLVPVAFPLYRQMTDPRPVRP